MNKIYKIMRRFLVSMLSFMLLFVASCDDVLEDVENLNAYEPAKTWSNEKLANAYLTNLYAKTIPSWPLNGGSVDEAGPGVVTAEAVTSQNNAYKPWSYSTIRKINILLKDIETGSLENPVKDAIIGQALFLRAFLYFKMTSNYGGVPIIKTPQSLDEDLMVKRNTTKECFDFIIEDLDKAFDLLPNRYSGDNFGRIDKATVLAYKGRVLLHKASPQFNPSNPYGNSYWTEAYNANKLAKDKLTEYGFKLISDYGEIFKNEGNDEVVFANIYINPGKTNGRSENGVRPLSESKNATGHDQPIWSLIEAYPMADGKKVGESTTYSYDVQSYWLNRDPRFYKTVVYNGSLYELSGKAGRRQYTTYDLVPFNIAHIDDIFGDKQTYGRTGFYCKKGIEEALPQNEATNNSTDWVEIRFAEVLLNYAEAANETGKTSEAFDVLKTIRARAGIEAGVDGNYGLSASMTTDQMREAILDERRVEFAFEGKRFSDLRRTRRWHLLNGTKKSGMEAFLKPEFLDADNKLRKNGDGNIVNADGSIVRTALLPEDFTYTVRECLNTNPEMVIPETYYFFPIKKSDLEKNSNLEQTKGWDGGTFDPTL